jgi:hypothetical protein
MDKLRGGQGLHGPDIGFYSSLPCIIALMAIQQGRTFTWDGKTAKSV